MGVETTALRWFQQVADGATVTEVAELERVSQPTVSRALATLQGQVGAPLLVKSGRLLRLTHPGAVFKRHVDRLVNALDDGLAAVEQLADPERGTVTLGAESSLGAWLVPSLVVQFRRSHPRVRFVVTLAAESWGAEPGDDLDDAGVDLALTAARPHGIPVQWRRLFTEPLFLAVAPAHPLAGRAEVALAEAADEDFVGLGPGSALQRQVQELCRTAGFDPKVVVVADDMPTLRGFVAAGLGVAVVPAGEPTPAYAARLLRLVDPGASREIGLAWPSRRRLLPAAESFRRSVLAQAR